MTKKKLTKKQENELSQAYRDYLLIKKDYFENGQFKKSVSSQTIQRFTDLEQTISRLNPEMLEFPVT